MVIRPLTWYDPTLKYPDYSDFSHGQNGRSSSQANTDYVVIHTSHPAYHPSRRYARRDFRHRFTRQAECAERLNQTISVMHLACSIPLKLLIAPLIVTDSIHCHCHRLYPVNLNHAIVHSRVL